jgi:hypothetical protein
MARGPSFFERNFAHHGYFSIDLLARFASAKQKLQAVASGQFG